MKKKLNDKELVEQLQSGDTRAFDSIVAKYGRHIYNFIFTKIPDETIAKDILQETYIKVFVNLSKSDSYIENGKLKNWMLRIANNLAMDYYRKKTRKVSDSFHFDFFLPSEPLYSPFDSELEMEYEQLLTRVNNCREKLSLKNKEILTLRFDKQMTFKEIAELNGTTISSALGLCRNAVLAIRKKV